MRCSGLSIDAEGIQALSAAMIVAMIQMAGMPGVLLWTTNPCVFLLAALLEALSW
jgi:hypothetical protein